MSRSSVSAIRRSLYSTATKSSRNPDIYDLVCIGGGPAGLSLISALRANASTRNLKIALIDGQKLSASGGLDNQLTFSNRCSSLTPSSVRFLRSIGAWDHIRAARVQSYHGMEVWDGVSGSKIQFDPSSGSSGIIDRAVGLFQGGIRPGARAALQTNDGGVVATMCENMNLTTSLLHNLQHFTKDFDFIDGTKVESIELGPEAADDKSLDLSQWPIVNLPDGRALAARLLVGADGANSPVRQFANIPSHGWDYNQHGVVATLDTDYLSHSTEPRTAYQRFLPTGPVALLPLPGAKASLVWSTTATAAARLKQLSPTDFVALVNAAFRLVPIDIDFALHKSDSAAEEVAWREPNTNVHETGLPAALPRITGVQTGSIASFPLRMRHASTYTGHRVALIGDAAHTIHPLAGQGLNLGLADAEALATRIAVGVDHGMDIGSPWCLDDYNTDRWAANNAMLGIVDKLQKLYSVGSGPVVWGRSLGLDLVNKLGPLKSALMSAAARS